MRAPVILKWLVVFGVCLLPVGAIAGEKCYKCHTMHASQDGNPFGDGPNNRLLVYSTCLACHTGSNSGTNAYYVLQTGSAPTDNTMLAGGNFYWVDQGDTAADHAKGHNLSGVNIADVTHTATAPGGTFSSTSAMNCAGNRGCHGDRSRTNDWDAMSGTHHNNATGQIATAPGSPAVSFRFLNGIEGYEADDQELVASSTNHNEYRGTDRTISTTRDSATISYLCSNCHGDFHGDSSGDIATGTTMVSPWLRHPTDFDMWDVRTKSDYAGVSNTYNNITPVGRLTIPASASATVMSADNDSIITCISCHRAHGSAYPSILRWDYRGWPTAGINGCNNCHTTKD